MPLPILSPIPFTRNMHVHLCLMPVRRLCMRMIPPSYAGADAARVAHVMFAVGEAVWCLLWWPHHAVVPDLTKEHYCNYRNQLHLSELSISGCVTHIWPIPMALGRAHVCSYCQSTWHSWAWSTPCIRIYILCENRPSIQSLALMHLAIKCRN